MKSPYVPVFEYLPNAYSFLWEKVDTDYYKTFTGIQERLEKQSPGVDFREDKFPGSGETHVCLACTELKDIKEKNIDQKQKKITKLLNMITAMTSLGANVRSPDARGRHPLYILMTSDYFQRGSQDITDLIKTLIEASGANDGDTRDEEAELTVIMQFIHDNDHERLRFLLEHGASPDKPGRCGNTPVLLAISENRVECLTILLESGADANKSGGDGITPLLHTITKNKHQCACILLKKAADPDQAGENGITPLLHAIFENRKEFVSTLLKFKANPNRFHQTDATQSPLLVAAWGNQTKILEILFMQHPIPTNVNISDKDKTTALMNASFLGHHKTVSLLLTHKATVDRLSAYGETALFMALKSTRRHKIATVSALLEAGANTNRKADDGSTPLSLTLVINEATERNTILDLLLKKGADTNQTNQAGNHALLMLCMNTTKERDVSLTATKLIMHDARIHHLNNNNETALFHAVKNRNLGAIQTILMTNNPSRSALWNDYNRTNHDGVSIRQMITEQNYRQEEPEIYQLLCSFLQGPAHESQPSQREEEKKQLQESLKTKEHELAWAKSDYEESSQGMLKEISTLERQLGAVDVSHW
ncbi:hypothetical protein GCM10023116_19690 [Kistimonas scapharcae]|uniref:Ankyrin n=1 Tax=Kistimonas scapharcae TaxID=1036133 RepID=A0ABP8V310_9GAMM